MKKFTIQFRSVFAQRLLPMRQHFSILVFISLSLILNSCRDFKQNVDLIIYNTKVYTLDSLNTEASCIAIKDSIIVAVGSDSKVRSRYSASKYVNGKGLIVYPGFIDAHSHFSGYAQFLQYADIGNAESFSEVLEILKKYHQQYPDRWIIGRGWDQNHWPGKAYPDTDILNTLYPDVPVILTRVDGHAVMANMAAVRIAKLPVQIPKGEILFRNGKANGIYLETTADRIKSIIPPPSAKTMTELLCEAAANCHAAGLTMVTDAGIDKEMILVIDSLQRAGILKMTIDAMINPTEENMDYFMHGGIYKTSFLRVGSIKIYADGALGSRGACLLRPYGDDSLNRGIIVTSGQEIRRICKDADKYGFQVCSHAIGDSAVRVILDVYAEFLKGHNDNRWRIEHAQVVNPSDMDKFGKYSVIPSVQATHATSDMNWATSRLGYSRIKTAYAYQDLLRQNGWLANGTDFPVEDISPLMTFYAAVARKDKQGNPENGYFPKNALTRIQALRSITCWAAKASFEESSRGSIEVGKLADLVILDADLLKVAENAIPKTQVKQTYLHGKKVFDASIK